MKTSKSIKKVSLDIGLFELVFIVFLILKLLNKIDWSWWWVTSPLWILAIISSISVVIEYKKEIKGDCKREGKDS